MFAVIDTNVLLVANGQHQGTSPNCVINCATRLKKMQESGITVIDDAFLILNEYQNKTNNKSGKGVGDVFLKWLLQKQANATHVQKVTITKLANYSDSFVEFPDQQLQPKFDAPDRKFAAVANAHPNKPRILQAADCKWLDWWPALAEKGVHIDFLCPNDVRGFYTKKFPEKPYPQLPN